MFLSIGSRSTLATNIGLFSIGSRSAVASNIVSRYSFIQLMFIQLMFIHCCIASVLCNAHPPHVHGSCSSNNSLRVYCVTFIQFMFIRLLLLCSFNFSSFVFRCCHPTCVHHHCVAAICFQMFIFVHGTAWHITSENTLKLLTSPCDASQAGDAGKRHEGHNNMSSLANIVSYLTRSSQRCNPRMCDVLTFMDFELCVKSIHLKLICSAPGSATAPRVLSH